MLIHPFAHARDVMEFYREAAAKAPDELTLMLAFITDPHGNQVVAIMACWSGGMEEGDAVLAPIRAFGPPLADLIHPMP
jgi:hypothetical protein